jgi:diguanylate cyclase (GGDEF)-like protein
VLAGVVTMMEYGFLHPNTGERLVAYSAILALQQAHIAFFILRKEDGTLRGVGGPLAVILGALCASNVVRIMGVVHLGAPKDYLEAGPFLAWIVIINSCLQCGAMVAYVWMTAALLRRDLERQASTDPLTGALNRRAIEQIAKLGLGSRRGAIASMTAIAIDLDGFKQINDTFGHAYGDATLQAVAACLKEVLRTHDRLVRVGGDEFVIFMPRTPITSALEIAERLRDSVERLEIPCGRMVARVTASFGLAEGVLSDWKHLVMLCDEALYSAKKAGGNQIVQVGTPG